MTSAPCHGTLVNIERTNTNAHRARRNIITDEELFEHIRQKNRGKLEEYSIKTGIMKSLLGENLTEKINRQVDGKLQNLNLVERKGLTAKEWGKVCALLKFVKEYNEELFPIAQSFRNSSQIFQYYRTKFIFENREHFYVVLLDGKNAIVKEILVSIGTINSVLVHPREVFREAIKMSAVSIILVHNHPSGNPMPSQEDLTMTRKLKECGELMSIPILDHVIIGEQDYFSFADKNML